MIEDYGMLPCTGAASLQAQRAVLDTTIREHETNSGYPKEGYGDGEGQGGRGEE